MNFGTIKNRFIFSMLLFVGLMLSITAIGTYLYFKHQTAGLIQSQQFTMVTTLARGLDEKLISSHNSLIAVAGVVPQKIFDNPEMAQAWLNDRRGIKRIFSNGLFLFTPEGKLLVENPYLPERRGKDFSFREYYQKTVATGKPYISLPYLSSKGGHPAIMMTAPIVAADGRLLAILGGAMDLMAQGSIFRTLIETRIGKTGYLYLYAPDRTLIVHPTLSRIMKKDVLPGMNRLFDSAIEGFEGSGETITSKGLHAISSFKHLNATDWILVANYPVAEAYQPITLFRNYYLIGILLLLVAAAVIARNLGIGITRPLTDLVEQTQTLARFDSQMELRLKYNYSDELKLLADSFNILLNEMGQRELSLQENRKRLTDIIDFLPDATLAIDKDKRIIIWNRAIEEMTGIPAAEMIGKGDYAYTIPFYGDARPQLMDLVFEDREETANLYQNVIREGNSFSAEAFCNALYGNKGAWVFVKASPLYDQSGNFTGVIERIRDITESKHLQQKLHQSMKMESIGRLAGGIAHDFNNKLAVIMGYAEMLKNKFHDDEDVFKELSAITRAAEHSRDITGQLLSFSRQQIISPGNINPNDVIKDTKHTLPRLIGEDIELSFALAENLWNVRIDPVQFDQILMNLTINARDAMPNGGTLHIATANATIDENFCHDYLDAKPGDYVQLIIADNGHGMDEETHKHIFEPFFTTKDIGKGTGLGLATIYGIVTQNRGFITVESRVGEGAIFNVFLPRLEAGVTAETKEIQKPVSGTETVLLVEDEEDVRKMVTVVLANLGYTVLAAGTAEDAIRLCGDADIRIDLVLSDVVMPKMSGKEMMERIEALRPGLKALFMSGYSSELILQKGVSEGSVHFIAKPFEMQNLNEKIREVLNQLRV